MTSNALLVPDLALGTGLVHVPGEPEARAGTLFVPAVPGVRVLGPPPLARALVRGYVRALLGMPRVDASAAVVVTEKALSVDVRMPGGTSRLEVSARGAPLRRRLRDGPAEVWLAPEGHACARAPGEARGLWVPLAVRFDPGPLRQKTLVPAGLLS